MVVGLLAARHFGRAHCRTPGRMPSKLPPACDLDWKRVETSPGLGPTLFAMVQLACRESEDAGNGWRGHDPCGLHVAAGPLKPPMSTPHPAARVVERNKSLILPQQTQLLSRLNRLRLQIV
jgi:hypothetical protein